MKDSCTIKGGCGQQHRSEKSLRPPASKSEQKEIVHFFFEPFYEEEESGSSVFVKMNMPLCVEEYNRRAQEIRSKISFYLQIVPQWHPEQLALHVARFFDKEAEIAELTTFYI